jgi:glycerophosphoryl diester phosphodiesterase
MFYIAHRGYWNVSKEKNTLSSFKKALENGYGIETDFRDRNGKLVISHDMSTSKSIPVEQFIELINEYKNTSPIAINIKADGLHKLIKKMIEKIAPLNYFVFDMSVPDNIGYLEEGLIFYTRKSEYEKIPALLKESDGVWLDAFKSKWFNEKSINTIIKNKKIAIVSPELHNRPHLETWEFIKKNNYHKNTSVSLCTDYPKQAQEYFNE